MMVCGVNLGILLICLVQVEYIGCLWETQGETFQKQNYGAYSPFPQNRLRQASSPSGLDQSLNRRRSGVGYSETREEPRKSNRAKVQYVRSHPKPQGPQGASPQKWSLRQSEIASASSVSRYPSPKKTDFTAVRTSPVEGPQGHRRHMSGTNPFQSSRENYAFQEPRVVSAEIPTDPKNVVQTSVTVRGKPVRGSRKQSYNQRERFQYNPVQGSGGHGASNTLRSYSWGRPQSTFNQEIPDHQDPSTVTYRVAEKYGGSLIIRLKNQDRSEEVTPPETWTSPPQAAFGHSRGQKVPKSVWRKVKSKGMALD